MSRVRAWLLVALAAWLVGGVAHYGSPFDSERAQGAEESIDPMGPNAACYVCHMTFVHEKIAKLHKAEKIGCIDCHGVSARHANDEHIGATPPDIVFKRDKVDAFCGKCHATHDAPAAKVVARFVQRKLPAQPAPICTDCHGQHRIDRAAQKKDDSGKAGTEPAASAPKPSAGKVTEQNPKANQQ